MSDMEPVDMSGDPVDPTPESALVEISTPPFSSPDPETEGLRMVPILDDAGVGEDPSIRAAGLSEGEESTGDEEADATDKTAAQWVSEIEATTTQEELDAVLASYSETGKDYKTVDAAAEKKQDELDNA